MTESELAKTVEVNDDEGVLYNHPELVQEHPSAASEWLKDHKKLVASAIGGIACLATGIIAGDKFFSRRQYKPLFHST